MALSLEKEVAGGRIAVWKISESEQELRRLVTRDDLKAVEHYRSAGRRMEALAWRALVRRYMPGARLSYNALGAPVMDEGFISVSHSGAFAAVVMAATPCGIDIESIERDFSRVAARYISPAEAALPESSDELFPAVLWCAKEVMYKMSGEEGLNLLEDMKINSLNMAAGHATGEIKGGQEVDIAFFTFERYLVAWAVRELTIDN